MKIKDIMTKDVLTLSPDISAKEAMDILFKEKISGLPVIDKDGKLVGMFTEKDVIRYLLPVYVEQVGKFVYQEDPKACKTKLAELKNIKVSKLMRKEVIATTEDTHLFEAARIIMVNKARRLPVIDKENRVIGIVARCDVLKALVG